MGRVSEEPVSASGDMMRDWMVDMISGLDFRWSGRQGLVDLKAGLRTKGKPSRTLKTGCCRQRTDAGTAAGKIS
jgi:hypothetical protein